VRCHTHEMTNEPCNTEERLSEILFKFWLGDYCSLQYSLRFYQNSTSFE
jgi:hypothetical protein